MYKSKNILKENKEFYALILIFLLSSFVVLISFGNVEIFLSLNSKHSFWLNIFFVNYTFFGDGIFTLALCGILFYKKQHKLALCILVAFLTSGIFVQVLKNLIFAPRPIIFFEASQYLFKLDNFGNSGGGYSSFPSGHTTSAFALATTLTVYFRKKYMGILLFLAAILVGYSRVYLAQHFPIDVLIGALIGTLFATLSIIFLKKEIKFYVPKNNSYKLLDRIDYLSNKLKLG